jgi:hypothetical protein
MPSEHLCRLEQRMSALLSDMPDMLELLNLLIMHTNIIVPLPLPRPVL